ncbi:Hypothetical protein LUCI_4817 [Lucifera butyrica]|uniref:Uncharacterized protein n=1 Tax=Lucifera butyrica TaxID=1351585 RepID=A0A498RHF6_9FIRM|nr:hypothetical protein [Lucifera butyrica]VBB09522.1 Hypothetical protein LUCI_4817 [Lucifera butyrica]
MSSSDVSASSDEFNEALNGVIAAIAILVCAIILLLNGLFRLRQQNERRMFRLFLGCLSEMPEMETVQELETVEEQELETAEELEVEQIPIIKLL